MSILYFAYDDKMFSPKLAALSPNALYKGVAKLPGYKLFFNHKSQDASGKGNIMPSQDPLAMVYGILLEISLEEFAALREAQEVVHGQQICELKVFPVLGSEYSAHIATSGQMAITIMADKEDIYHDLVPYSWYKEMIVKGAKEHHLPNEYIHLLEPYASVSDPNLQRQLVQKRILESSMSHLR